MRNQTRLHFLFSWLSIAALVFFSSPNTTYAYGNFVSIRLPKGVTVELPRNWAVLSNNRRITLDSWVQAKTEANGVANASSELAFAANYYDEQNSTAGMFNIRYYPNLDVSQPDARAAGAADIKELDSALRQNIVPGIEMSGSRLLAWLGTTKQSINGTSAFITEYRRSSLQGGGFRARLIRIFNGQKSFTITISYREDQEFFLRTICDRIINSIRI